MAAKLGFEAIQYVLKKVLTKKGIKGIATIPGKAYDMRMKQLVDEMAFKMKALGYDINKVTQKEVQGLLDSAEALAKQKPTPESLIKGKKYTDERGRTWDFGTKDRPFPGFEPKVVPEVSGIDKALKSDFEKTIKKKDRPSIRLMKNFEKELTDIDLAKEGYNLQEISILKRARNVMKKEGQNPDDALQWVKSEMADDAGIEFEEFMPDFDWGDFPGKAEGGRVPLFKGKIIKGIASLGKKKKPKGKIWKDETGKTMGIGFGDMATSGGLDTAFQKGIAMSNAMKKMGLDPASSKDYFKFEKLVSEGMVGFPNELKEQIIRAKYGDVVDQKLLNQMLADSNPQRISEVMGTIDEGLIMQQKGMHPDEIVETIKTSLKRKPQAEGGRASLMYGGDPGFQFEYGGSWADWRDQHQHQMPVTDYIKTKMPKERLPFREPMIFGGSAGLKAMWKTIMKNLSKGRDKPITKLFPKLSQEEKEIMELGKKYLPRESKELLESEKVAKIEGVEILLERLRHDKKIIELQAKNKAMNDPGLDFLMKDLQDTVYPSHLKKYTDIDKDILQLENIKKNLLTKDRKLNAEGGRIGYAEGTSSPRFNHPDKRQGILGSGVTWTELMEELHPFSITPGTVARTKRDLIDPIFKKKLKWNELDEYYKQLEMDKDMRDPESVPSRGEQYIASGGLAYMLGEPTYMKYEGGGSVGHAPWHKPSGQPQPQGQDQSPTPQVGGAQSPGRGQPNPMKGPQGLPSLAPRTMDPAHMQQQMMQKAMMGQQGQQRGQPRMGMANAGFIEGPDYPIEIGPLKVKPRASITEGEVTEPYEGIGSPIVKKEIGTTDYGADMTLDIGKGIYGIGKYDRGRRREDIYFEGEKVMEKVPTDSDIFRFGVGLENEGFRAEVVYNPDAERYDFKLVKSFNQGGRIGFGLGGIDKGRRAFMKWLAGITAGGIAAGTGLLKLSKLAPKAIPKVTETIIKSNAPGMPAWFPSLVRRVMKEGDDITAKAGSEAMERQTVHSVKLPESGTPVQVTRDLVTDDIIVDIGEQTKHGWSSGRHGQPTQLILKKGEWIEPTKTKKGIKTKDEFSVEEAEFTGGHPENIKFEDVSIEKYGDHASDFTEVEKYAVGKNIDKKIIGKKAERDAWAEGRAESAAEDVDFAKGGLAYMLGE